jgi:two-component system response regulator PilR (NtrC family)
MTGSILIVDDEKGQRDILSAILSKEGYRILAVPGAREALQELEQGEFDLLLTDLKMQGMSGMELMERVLSDNPKQCVVMMTAHGTLDTVKTAIKMGAFDYLEKPLERDDLILTLKRTFEHIMLLKENRVLHKKLAETKALPNMIGEHPKMMEVVKMINKIAPTSTTVLIYGESGTGKELVARAIHDVSAREAQPFVAVNCGAIPDNLLEAEFFGYRKGAFTGAHEDRAGFFQAAEGGTLFLDEIGDLPLAMQSKLLRVIQERSVRPIGATAEQPLNVRIVSATHKDLAVEVQAGRFRQDLFYRLNVICIRVPPLRERSEDIGPICLALLERIARDAGVAPTPGLTADGLAHLGRYAFPGNVRELENLLHRALALSTSQTLTRADLDLPDTLFEPANAEHDTVPAAPDAAPCTDAEPLPGDLARYLDEVERRILLRALQHYRFNRTAAGAGLGLSLRQIRYRMARLGITESDLGDTTPNVFDG